MITELKHFPVNWVDGMKISRRHFEQNEFFVHDALRDAYAVGLTNFNYGILPLSDSLNVQIVCDIVVGYKLVIIHIIASVEIMLDCVISKRRLCDIMVVYRMCI